MIRSEYNPCPDCIECLFLSRLFQNSYLLLLLVFMFVLLLLFMLV